jgi:hypothetical protein
LSGAGHTALGKDGFFAECQAPALNKEYFKKQLKNFFAECLPRQHSGKESCQDDSRHFLCRVLTWHSAKPLLSA